jgi:hypothetical protein
VEALKIPVTLVNEGAQTGAVLSLTLTVSDQAGRSKTFYSASTVPDQGAPAPFTPIVLEGHSSKSALLLFYTRGAAETVEQIIGAPGSYKFTLTLDEGRSQGGLFNLLGPKDATKLGFARALPSYDARMDAMPLYAENWQSSVSGESK